MTVTREEEVAARLLGVDSVPAWFHSKTAASWLSAVDFPPPEEMCFGRGGVTIHYKLSNARNSSPRFPLGEFVYYEV